MNAWDNARHWPLCYYRSQRDAGLPAGPLDEQHQDTPLGALDYLALGFAIGLLWGLAAAELWGALA